MTVGLSFQNFNGAAGVCSAQYVPGTVRSMADVPLEATACSFTPQNLVPPSVPSPSVVSAYNVSATRVSIVFDEDLLALTGLLNSHISVSFASYLYTPSGPTITVTLRPSSLSVSGGDTLVLIFPEGNVNNLSNAVGDVTITYDGAGLLSGEGGPVYPFTATFTPTGLDPKFNAGHLEMLRPEAFANGSLTRIYHKAGYESHLIRPTVTASGTLTHINDLLGGIHL